MALTLPVAASAGTVECPSDAQVAAEDLNRQYSLTTNPDSVCFAYGDGNLNGAGNDAFLEIAPGVSFVGQNDAFIAGSTDFTGTSGDFAFNAVGGVQYYVGIKDGGDPKWAVFQLPILAVSGIFSGEWGVVSPGGSLSHLALYSGEGPEPIGSNLPEPSAILLLGAGLAGVASRLRRRRVNA
jgi:hypothetical protein